MNNKIREGTVCFIRDNNNVLLSLIEYSPVDRKWNGIGGYIEEGESPEDALIRELQEETYIILDKSDLKKVREISISSQLNLHVFVANTYKGVVKPKDPTLKELKWFPIDQLPFEQMHKGNNEWLPQVLAI